MLILIPNFFGDLQLPLGTTFYGTGEAGGPMERTGKRVIIILWCYYYYYYYYYYIVAFSFCLFIFSLIGKCVMMS